MDWINIPNIDIYAVLTIIVFFAFIETILGHYHNSKRRKDDWILELLGFLVVAAVKSLQVLFVLYIGSLLIPNPADALNHWSIFLAFPFYMLIDDFLQYWYHRAAHENEWLWKHHLSHHAAQEMGIFVSYRNSVVYYLLMPNLWWVAICTYLGMAEAVIIGIIFKQIIVTASHSTWKWDEYLYKFKTLNPLTSLIERIFITPAFHHAHHGISTLDGISDPNGNFGNTFSFWDQIFGTSKFTRKFPETYGLISDTNDPWYTLLLYPFLKAPNAESEISKGFKKKDQKEKLPFQGILKKGEYLYCQCGKSTDQPFCNGFHHGSKIKPLKFEVKKDAKVSLCQCKLTKTPPYCDNSHLML